MRLAPLSLPICMVAVLLLTLSATRINAQTPVDVATTDVVAEEESPVDEVLADEGITDADLEEDLAAESLPTTNGFSFWWEGVRDRVVTALTFNAEAKAERYRHRLHQLDRKAEACAEIGDDACLARIDEHRATLEERAEAHLARRQELHDTWQERFEGWREQRAERREGLEEKIAERRNRRQELTEERKNNRRDALQNRVEHRKDLRQQRRDTVQEHRQDRRDAIEERRDNRRDVIQEHRDTRRDAAEELREERRDTREERVNERIEIRSDNVRLRHEQRIRANDSANVETNVRIEATTE